MKKILSMILVLTMLLGCSAALAEGMGVQVIGGPETETEPVSLDDIKLNVAIEIPNSCVVTPTTYEVVDSLRYYKAGRTSPINGQSASYSSGNEAEYVLLRMDIMNTTLSPVDFLSDVSIIVTSDDTYEFAGWAFQYNYDNETYNNAEYKNANTEYVIDVSDQFAIDPMYLGHYVFGCTLPNSVLQAKTPLVMVVHILGNELTYNIRK